MPGLDKSPLRRPRIQTRKTPSFRVVCECGYCLSLSCCACAFSHIRDVERHGSWLGHDHSSTGRPHCGEAILFRRSLACPKHRNRIIAALPQLMTKCCSEALNASGRCVTNPITLSRALNFYMAILVKKPTRSTAAKMRIHSPRVAALRPVRLGDSSVSRSGALMVRAQPGSFESSAILGSPLAPALRSWLRGK